jgi:cytochrome c-type biogenesis protein CcmH
MSKTTSNKARILALRQQLQLLQAEHAAGTLSAEGLAQARQPLERQLVDLMLAHPEAAATAAAASTGGAAAAPAAAQPAAQRPSKVLVASLLAGVLVLAAAGYSWTGSPLATRVASGATEGAAPPHEGAEGGADEQQFAAAVEKLAQRLKDQPENAEGWAMLARSYARLGKHADAVPAFAKAVALRGDDARLLADYADTLAVHNGRALEGEPMKLVERALKLDPQNPKALALSGTAAFDRRDFKEAVRQWELLASVLPGDSDFLPQLQGSIDQARELAGMPKGQPVQRAAGATPPSMAAAPAAPAAPAAGGQPQAASSAKVQGTVKLSPKLAAQAAPTDTVFIFARPAEGSRMPLAIQRHQVKDLPITFTLDDSTAMSPAARLSLHEKVVISARVSKSGQAAPSPGDLVGQTAPVSNTTTGLVIEIADVVK